MEIHICDRTHKFQNKTGLDAKDNSELYKSKQVNSAQLTLIEADEQSTPEGGGRGGLTRAQEANWCTGPPG
jgi:hypothetical protein